MNLTREHWPLGWIPSDNNVNGRREGLLRMRNLRLDDKGVISLTKGTTLVNSSAFGASVHSIYSQVMAGSKFRFVGLTDGDGFCDSGNFSTPELLYSGGDPARTAFVHYGGNVYLSSGLQRKKFDGSVTANWGLPQTGPPFINAINQPFLDASGKDGAGNFTNWTLEEGSGLTNSADYVKTDFNSVNFRTIFQCIYPTPLDTTTFSDGTNKSTPEDQFHINVRPGDVDFLISVRVEFLLQPMADGGVIPDGADYYWKEFINNDGLDNIGTNFRKGVNVWTNLSCNRGDFIREGNDNSKDWTNVYAVRVTFLHSTQITAIICNELFFFGGARGTLNGEYEYRAQLYYDNGFYVAKGPLSDITETVFVTKGYVQLQSPPSLNTDPFDYFTGVYFYRRNKAVNNKWVKVATLPITDPGFPYINDTVSDDDAQILGNETFQNLGNTSLQSVKSNIDEFFGMAPFGERIVIITFKDILLTDRLNPDAIDTRFTLRLFGGNDEINLWIERVSAGVLLVATNKGIYEITGTLNDQPDGSLDANIRNLGENHPPIALDHWLDSGNIVYIAADGYRLTNGNLSQLISADLNLLFNRENRYGLEPIITYLPAQARYPITIGHGNIWTSNPLRDGSRVVLIRNIQTGTWREWLSSPSCFFTEEDGTILAGYGNGDNYLRVIDFDFTYDGITGIPDILLETISDHNDQIRNRKDAFTLKLKMDTGNIGVGVYLSKDEGSFIYLGTYQFNGPTEQLIDLYSVPALSLGFRYALRLVGAATFTVFNFYAFSIEYDPRPEQLTSLRIQPDNLGTFSRKRFTNYAGVIDTLSNTVTFQPIIDNVLITPVSTFNTPVKQTFVHYFDRERIGTDISGILTGGPFEFYGTDKAEIVSEKLPIPVKYLVIPANNYGSPNRKRHSSYKFQIHTRGADVKFTPIIDTVSYAPLIFSTNVKQTVEYFFTTDTIGIDIGGILETQADTPFEFYGVIIPQDLELLPPRLKEFRIPENNYGIAAKKRIRTMPMVINTNGSDVTFTPIVDQSVRSAQISTFNTPSKQTVLHYFTDDEFGIDFSGELNGDDPFEFYGLLQPENVETLPVAKKYDQIGPIHFDRLGKIIGLRIRLVATGTALPWKIFAEDTEIYSDSFVTTPNIETVLEKEWIVRSKLATICRVEIGPSANPFHRYYVEIKVNYGGDQRNTGIKWIRVGKGPPS